MKIYDENGKMIINEHIPNPGIATVLACIAPGLGHIYCGKISRGMWVFLSTTILMVILVGIFIYAWQIFDAWDTAKTS